MIIKLSVKGFADYMTATPAKQRKILRDYKYPQDDEAYAKRLYYREARDVVAAFHKNDHDHTWLGTKAEELSNLGDSMGGQSRQRLKHNSRGIRQYGDHFSDRRFEIQPDVRWKLVFGDVQISVVPDLVAVEKGKPKVVKLDFSNAEPNTEGSKIIAQCMFEAATGRVQNLTSSSVLYLDVARGKELRGARAGSRAMREIEAACQTIEAIWPQL